MSIEITIKRMERDFEALISQYNIAADQEYMLAIRARDGEQLNFHLNCMEQHERMARMYRRMKDCCIAFVDVYGADIDSHI